jgi:hypothetical protein
LTLIEVIDAARSLANEELDSGRTFPDNTSTFWKDSTLITYFNMVQHEVEQEIVQTFEDYFLTQTTLGIVSGCADYVLPTRFMKVRRVEDFRESEPLEIVPSTINERSPDLNPVSRVRGNYWTGGYYIRGNQIVLHDTPTFTSTAAVRMFYIRALADLSSASDSSDIPVEHHRILVWGVYKLMLTQQQTDTSTVIVEYDRLMNKLKGYCESRQIQRPRQVKSRQTRGR